jgi:hypothetical protein
MCAQGGGDRLHPQRSPHLALAMAIGLVAVRIEALADSTVTGATDRIPPPAFGAWKVDSGRRRWKVYGAVLPMRREACWWPGQEDGLPLHHHPPSTQGLSFLLTGSKLRPHPTRALRILCPIHRLPGHISKRILPTKLQ